MRVENKVVVVTGASSGVGRATALAFADATARLVLAARGREALESVAEACRERGAKVIIVPTDVSDADAVESLAKAAEDQFGRIDVWASIAGVGAVGPFLASPLEEHDQTVRTDLLGPLYGAYAALKRFDAQRDGGVILHMNSVGAFAAVPYGVAYSTSKFGLRGLSLALRAELASRPNVYLCEVYAPFLDTPGADHAANRLGVRLRPAPLVDDPERVGRLMVDLVRRPRAEVMLNVQASAIRFGALIVPKLTAWTLGRVVEIYSKVAQRQPSTSGAVEAPSTGGGAVHGGLRSAPLRIAAAVGAISAIGLLLATSLSRSEQH